MTDPVIIGNATLSGIYTITNSVNGKQYVGSAVHFGRRWAQHRSALTLRVHKSPKLAAAWTKYGPDAFRFDVIEVVNDKADLIAREQYWLDKMETVERGYNTLPVAGSRLGIKHSDETRAKMKAKRALRPSKPCSTETKRKISLAQLGRAKPPVSDEYRAKMSAVMRGKKKPPRTDEQRARAALVQTGKKVSDQTRLKMSAAQTKRWAKERSDDL